MSDGSTIGTPVDVDILIIGPSRWDSSARPLREWGLDLHDNRHLVVDSAMRTNLPGMFVAGDITDYDGKVRLIAVGFWRGGDGGQQRSRPSRPRGPALLGPLHRHPARSARHRLTGRRIPSCPT